MQPEVLPARISQTLTGAMAIAMMSIGVLFIGVVAAFHVVRYATRDAVTAPAARTVIVRDTTLTGAGRIAQVSGNTVIEGCGFGAELARGSTDERGLLVVGNDGVGGAQHCHLWFARETYPRRECWLFKCEQRPIEWTGDGWRCSVGESIRWNIEPSGMWGDVAPGSDVVYECREAR